MNAELLERIRRELHWTREAQEAGNEGRARVCARRAAGLAIRQYFLEAHGTGYAPDALRALRRAADDDTLPAHVRHAVARLIARENDPTPRTTDPLQDAHVIISHFYPEFVA